MICLPGTASHATEKPTTLFAHAGALPTFRVGMNIHRLRWRKTLKTVKPEDKHFTIPYVPAPDGLTKIPPPAHAGVIPCSKYLGVVPVCCHAGLDYGEDYHSSYKVTPSAPCSQPLRIPNRWGNLPRVYVGGGEWK